MTSTELPRISVTVDVVLFTVKDGSLQVLLTRRTKEPCRGQMALPGGYVHAQSDADSAQAAARVLATKVGLVAPYLEQLHTFADAARDPRGWSVSIVYFALVPLSMLDSAQHGTEPTILIPVDALGVLAFDHVRIIQAAAERLRNRQLYPALPLYLAGAEFTLTEAQDIYEAVLETKFEVANFRRMVLAYRVLKPVEGAARAVTAGRYAKVYGILPGANLVELEKGARLPVSDGR